MKPRNNSRALRRSQRVAYSAAQPFGEWANSLFALRPSTDGAWAVMRFWEGDDEPDVLRRGLCTADAVREAFDIGAHGFRLLVCDGAGWNSIYQSYDAGAQEHRAAQLQRVARAAAASYRVADELAGWLA